MLQTSHKKRTQRSLLLAFLTGKYGCLLKDRLKTNLLVSYIAKDDLYRIPLPVLSDEFDKKIHYLVESSLSMRKRILEKQAGAEEVLLTALGLADWTPPEPLSYSATASQAIAAGRFDAQYFMPAKEQVHRSLACLQGRALGARMDSIREMFIPDRELTTMRVRNYDVTDALVPLLDAEKEPVLVDEIGSVKKVLLDGDVAVSRLRAYLKEIAVVRTGDNIRSVGSSEFIVLRPKVDQEDISPETLMVFLRSTPVQTILKWCQDGSQHPRFSENDLLSIPVPDAVGQVSGQITRIVQDGFVARNHSRQRLEAAKRAVEIAIEDSEGAAITFLDQGRRSS